MCQFKSAICTKKRLYVQVGVNSHEDIIDIFGLGDDPEKIVRVELVPPDLTIDTFKNVESWKFNIDQDIVPDWFVAEEWHKSCVDWMKRNIITDHVKALASPVEALTGSCDKLIGTGYIQYLFGHVAQMHDNSSVAVMWGNSSVAQMHDNSSVAWMWDNSSVAQMHDNSSVAEMRGNSSVAVMRGNSSVAQMRGNSSVARMHDNSSVAVIRGNSSVARMRGNSSVARMHDNSSVAEMWGNSSVAEMCGNSSVERMCDNSSVAKMCGNSSIKKDSR